MFLKASESKVTEPEVVAAWVGRHAVTQESIMQACLRNGCQAPLPIQYALKYLPDFQLEECLAELIEALLNQPYRAIMLR